RRTPPSRALPYTTLFRSDVTYSGKFKYRTNRATRDNSSTFCSRFHQYVTRTETSVNFMRDCCSYDRYFYKTLLCIVNRFFNRFRVFKCFPHAKADSSISISYNYNSCKAETTSTFYNFSYTVNGYYTFFKFCLVRIIISSHRNFSLLLYRSSCPGSRCSFAHSYSRLCYTYPPLSKESCI